VSTRLGRTGGHAITCVSRETLFTRCSSVASGLFMSFHWVRCSCIARRTSSATPVVSMSMSIRSSETPEVIDGVGVPGREAGLDPPLVPPVDHRLTDPAVDQPAEARSAVSREAQEGGGGSLADPDVVGMTGDAVRAEGGHDVGSLVVEYGRDPVDQLVERHVPHAAVGIAEPLLPVRRLADDAPGVGVLNRRAAPRFSRVAPLPSAIAPPSPSVACTKKNRNSVPRRERCQRRCRRS